MSHRNFLLVLTIILSTASTVVSQTPTPEKATDRRPGSTRPAGSDRVVGKAPENPKKLPPGQHEILSVKYIDTLPGAQVTIKNVGGLSLEKGGLVLDLIAVHKKAAPWSNYGNPGAGPLPVVCPYTKTGGNVYGQNAVPFLKAGEAITMNIRFQHRGKDITGSLVDFATRNNCGIAGSPVSSFPNHKYYIHITINALGGKKVTGGEYLHP